MIPGVSRNVVRILALATEWSSGHGGLSTLNRSLCTALAAAGADVMCRVLAATHEEDEQASMAGVTLSVAPDAPGTPRDHALTHRAGLPDQAPDLILGHGRITGQHARVLAEDVYPGARWYLVTCTIPDLSEWFRPETRDTAGARAEERTRLEWDLGSAANRVVAVGPQLYERARLYLSAFPGVPTPIRIDPGFDIVDPAREPPRGKPIQILVSGRLDDGVKGLDIAARAMRPALKLSGLRVSDVELVARGVKPERATEFRAEIQRLAGLPGLSVIPRSYTSNTAHLREDLLRASLVLMPSRSEPFGLVGLEAIVAGTPVLVSGLSGLGDLLEDVVPDEASRMVVPVTGDDDQDAIAWGHAIANAIHNRTEAFANLELARKSLAEQRTWAMAAQEVLTSLYKDLRLGN